MLLCQLSNNQLLRMLLQAVQGGFCLPRVGEGMTAGAERGDQGSAVEAPALSLCQGQRMRQRRAQEFHPRAELPQY